MNANSLFSYSERIESQSPQELLQNKYSNLDQQIKCRICYETAKQKKPLVSLCACLGTIKYVHEECILDWIAQKIQLTNTLEIPNCQICNTKFSAKLKIGKQRLSFSLLLEQLKSASKIQSLEIIFHLVIFLVSIFTIYTTLNAFIYNNLWPQNTTQGFISNEGVLRYIFTNIIIQLYGILHFYRYLGTKQKWINQSKVHIVEVLLLPKITYQ